MVGCVVSDLGRWATAITIEDVPPRALQTCGCALFRTRPTASQGGKRLNLFGISLLAICCAPQAAPPPAAPAPVAPAGRRSGRIIYCICLEVGEAIRENLPRQASGIGATPPLVRVPAKDRKPPRAVDPAAISDVGFSGDTCRSPGHEQGTGFDPFRTLGPTQRRSNLRTLQNGVCGM